MPFKSKAQMRAAFGGYLGKKMKSKAKEWAHETPNLSTLPEHKKAMKAKQIAVKLKERRSRA
jgi:hypothetical protein